METNPNTNSSTDPETELTMRALDPFFETDEMRDHANQWHISEIWSDEPETPKPLETELP